MILDDKNTLDENHNGPRRIPEYLETPAHLLQDMEAFLRWMRSKEEEAITRWNKKHDEVN